MADEPLVASVGQVPPCRVWKSKGATYIELSATSVIQQPVTWHCAIVQVRDYLPEKGNLELRTFDHRNVAMTTNVHFDTLWQAREALAGLCQVDERLVLLDHDAAIGATMDVKTIVQMSCCRVEIKYEDLVRVEHTMVLRDFAVEAFPAVVRLLCPQE